MTCIPPQPHLGSFRQDLPIGLIEALKQVDETYAQRYRRRLGVLHKLWSWLENGMLPSLKLEPSTGLLLPMFREDWRSNQYKSQLRTFWARIDDPLSGNVELGPIYVQEAAFDLLIKEDYKIPISDTATGLSETDSLSPERRVRKSDLDDNLMRRMIMKAKSPKPSHVAVEVLRDIEGAEAVTNPKRIESVRKLMGSSGYGAKGLLALWVEM